MLLRSILALLVVFSSIGLTSPAAAKAKKDSKPTLNDVSMEVAALLAVYEFQLTTAQMEKLRALAKDTAARPSKRQAPRASKTFRDKLQALHKAMIAGDDFESLKDDVDELRETEKPSLDDDIALTAAARRRAPEFLKQIKANQLANFLAENAEEIVDPLDTLTNTFWSMRAWQNGDVKDKSDELAEQIAILVAGVDVAKSKKVRGDILALVKHVRAVDDLDLPEELPNLERAAAKLVGSVGPVDVLRNFAEHSLAELLSNPRLEPALRARLKNAK
jgi:predicted lipoprotein